MSYEPTAGTYELLQPLYVTSGLGPDTPQTGKLQRGQIVEIISVEHIQMKHRGHLAPHEERSGWVFQLKKKRNVTTFLKMAKTRQNNATGFVFNPYIISKCLEIFVKTTISIFFFEKFEQKT